MDAETGRFYALKQSVKSNQFFAETEPEPKPIFLPELNLNPNRYFFRTPSLNWN